MMFREGYKNFVRPEPSQKVNNTPQLNGDEIKKYYLNEVGNIANVCLKSVTNNNNVKRTKSRKCSQEINVSNHSLFLVVQNNCVDKLQRILDTSPDKINITDDYGWTLLMIACQANSTECVIELLNRGIDTSVRDKAGNSARSLVIRNKNVALAHVLLSNNRLHTQNQQEIDNKPAKEQFVCTTCNNKVFPDKTEHLSSTIHNLTASKGKKIPTNYIIPESNKGYQLMLKDGWDKESGLGPDGLGTKYPIKTVIKNDKKGLGNKNKTNKIVTKHNMYNKTTILRNYQKNRKMEIDFRREFY